MSNFTDFFPAASGGGGGGIPKYEEFTSSGTFTPTQALIDAGGRVAYLIVGGGERGSSGQGGQGGAGGAVRMGYATLTSTTGCAVTIGAGGSGSDGANGGDTIVAFSSAGGTDITSQGGAGTGRPSRAHGSFGGKMYRGVGGVGGSAGSGVLGYGMGGAAYENGTYYNSGKGTGQANTGDGSRGGEDAGSGFVRITWFE